MLESWARQELLNSTADQPHWDSPVQVFLVCWSPCTLTLSLPSKEASVGKTFAKCILRHSCVQTGFGDPRFFTHCPNRSLPGYLQPDLLSDDAITHWTQRQRSCHSPHWLSSLPTSGLEKPHSKYIGLSQELSVSVQMFPLTFPYYTSKHEDKATTSSWPGFLSKRIFASTLHGLQNIFHAYFLCSTFGSTDTVMSTV